MINIKFDVDPGNVFGRKLTELEKTQIPFATMQAVNAVAFQIRQQWADIAPRVFKNPVALTVKAALYKKAKKNTAAVIFLRDEASNGVSPAKYLQAQVLGGGRALKGIERMLSYRGFMPKGMYVVPGQGARLDAHGNIPRSQINALKSQLGIQQDQYTNSTGTSTKRRLAKEKKTGARRGTYFAVSTPRGGLKPGVYQRLKTGFGNGVASILHFIKPPRYRKRYDIFKMAETVYQRRTPEIFKTELQKAVASTWNRNFGK